MNIAIVRGTFLAEYECQIFYPLLRKNKITAFSSLKPFQNKFPFEVVKLPSPMDISFGPLDRLKMPVLNRLFTDAQWLIGLEDRLRGFDIAHTADTFYHYSHQCIVAKRKGYVKKVVATVFENIPFNNEGIWGRKTFKRDVIAEADHLIAISNRSREALLLEGASDKKVSVITQHIDTSRFIPGERQRKQNNHLTILFAGRVEFYKGVYEIVYAAKRLLSDPVLSRYSLQFVFVGKGSEYDRLIDLVGKLGIQNNVVFKSLPYGRMHDAYHSADIFVAPSRATRTYQEQFCTVLLEAQASGLPIVTTSSGGIPENVGDAAILVNPGDFYSLTVALKQLVLSPRLRKTLGQKARRRAVEKFDIKIGAQKLEELYKYILQKDEKK